MPLVPAFLLGLNENKICMTSLKERCVLNKIDLNISNWYGLYVREDDRTGSDVKPEVTHGSRGSAGEMTGFRLDLLI